MERLENPTLRIEISPSQRNALGYPKVTVTWVADLTHTEAILEPKGLRNRPTDVRMGAASNPEVDMSDKACKITASDVADYILASVDESSGDNISNLKLQKLVYYAQGFHLALHDGQPLFEDAIVAWEHGPVVPALWRKYKEFGSRGLPAPESYDRSRFNSETSTLLDEVNHVYGQFSAWKLRDMTHEEAPWKNTDINAEIPKDLMRGYFRTLLIDGQG